MQQLLNTDVTAIFIFNDLMAFGAIQAIQEQGKRIPEDYSIISYNYSNLTKLLHLPIDSVNQDTKELGEKAFELLLKQLDDPKRPKHDVRLEPELMIKGSVRRSS